MPSATSDHAAPQTAPVGASATVRTVVHRAYKFRIYPTKAQHAELSEWERQLRFLWNLAHEQRLQSLQRHMRPKNPDVAECRSCGAPTIDETVHVGGCSRTAGYHKGACRDCGAKLVRTTQHTAACAFTDYFRQGREMTELMRADEQVGDQLTRVVCSARQEILRDLDKAWQRWRKKLAGRPHFKRRTDSVRIYLSTTKHWKVEGGNLSLAGVAASVGPLKIRQDRPWPGDAKFTACHLVRDVDQWFAVFPLEFSVEKERPKGGAVGINRGAVHAVADSYGRRVDSPHYYTRALTTIRDLSRDLARKVKRGTLPPKPEIRYRSFATKPAELDALAQELGVSQGCLLYEMRKHGSIRPQVRLREQQKQTIQLPSEGRNRTKAQVRLARAHRTIRRQREWFLHDQSSYYTSRYGLIGIEDWSTKEMTSSEPDEKIEAPKNLLNRKILDVGWYELARQLEYKAEATGTRVVKVEPGIDNRDPAGISTMDSYTNLPMATSASGNQIAENGALGDVNAARNVLLRALRAPKVDPPKVRTTIKIKGRQKRPETAGKPLVDASGGAAPVRAPVDGGTFDREVEHCDRTVEPDKRTGT